MEGEGKGGVGLAFLWPFVREDSDYSVLHPLNNSLRIFNSEPHTKTNFSGSSRTRSQTKRKLRSRKTRARINFADLEFSESDDEIKREEDQETGKHASQGYRVSRDCPSNFFID